MAGDEPLVAFMHTLDWYDDSVIYGVRLETVPSGDDEPPAQQIRLCPDPVGRWAEDECDIGSFAAVSGGATILGLVHRSRDTVIHDTATRASAPGPRLRRRKRNPAMLSVGDHAVLVMSTTLWPGARSSFEALRRRPGRGTWRAEPLPDPPLGVDGGSGGGSLGLDDEAYAYVAVYFTVGTRAWISVTGRGTFSMDMAGASCCWRKEGPWELPLSDRGVFVPELGSVIGIADCLLEPGSPGERCTQVCAVDVDARPPAVRRVWQFPAERVEDVAISEEISLAYLGGGRFCLARSVVVDVEIPTDGGAGATTLCEGTGTSFTVVEVNRLPTGDLLAKYGNPHRHVWPQGYCGHAYFIQPA